MTHVLSLNVGDSTRKLVLLGYANHAHKDGTAAWAKPETVAEYANCSKRTVQRHMAKLLADGYIREGDQSLVARYPADRRPIVYDIAMSDEVRESWAADGAADGRRAAAAKAGATRRGDNLSPRSSEVGETGSHAGGDNLSPRSEVERGDTHDTPRGDTAMTQRGDTAMSPKPSENHPVEPSSDDSLRSSSLTDAQDTLVDVEPVEPTLRFKVKRGLPDDFTVTKRMRGWYVEQGFTGFDPLRETEQFKDHARATGVKYLDWEAAWMNWMRNAAKYAARSTGRGTVTQLRNRHTSSDPSERERMLSAFNQG